ncbi:MAG: Rieske (2Fe-2S) protein [Phycisphaerales bacterium]|jgi:nitrite reductase/ring-hydroxylating ferredoxin subunit|nr:Rieske (2Fe-2S) protein [Phycisphaerales bacterium]
MSWTSLCELGELTEGEGTYVEIGGFQLAVFLSEGKVHVMDNTCPHAGGSLAGGHVENGCAVCPVHQWCFGLEDGLLSGSKGFAVRVYPTRLMPRDGKQTLVQAELPIY